MNVLFFVIEKPPSQGARLWWIGYIDYLNWKRVVAAACESYQSGIQRTVDGLLWMFFNGSWLWWHSTH